MCKAKQHGWEVEWCTKLPQLPDGGADVDNAEYSVEDFKNEEEAFSFAKSVLPSDCFGAVAVREFETDKYGSKDYLTREEVS